MGIYLEEAIDDDATLVVNHPMSPSEAKEMVNLYHKETEELDKMLMKDLELIDTCLKINKWDLYHSFQIKLRNKKEKVDKLASVYWQILAGSTGKIELIENWNKYQLKKAQNV